MTGGRPVFGCVLLVDLDHFKLVRWGGEEFLAVLDSIAPEQADLTIARLLEAVRRDPIVCDGQSIRCTISIGYACFPMPGSTKEIRLETAIRLVDKALYEAKRRGRRFPHPVR
jgi:diguanylate cyclase (GGDEF)-like protein